MHTPLTAMSLEVLAKLNELVPNPGCVQQALESILESCQTPERLEERTWLGIKLSICEFEAANVYYPPVCSDYKSISRCTQLLETKATWWTTFSGNYRHISAICLEYKPHFESRKVLAVFKNASQLFDDYQTELDKVLKGYQGASDHLSKQWINATVELSSGLSQASSNMQSLRQLIQNATTEATDILSPLAGYAESVESKMKSFMVSMELLDTQSLEVYRRVEAFNSTMVEVESRHIYAAENLESSVNASIFMMESEVKRLQSTLGAINLLLSAFGAVLRFFWPFILLSVVLGLLYLSARFRRRSTNLYEEKRVFADVYSDLVFH